MFENLKKALKRTQKTCPKCDQESIVSWIVTTPNGKNFDLGYQCSNPSCRYEWLWKPGEVFKAYHDAENKDINWWYYYLINAIEYCIITKQNQTITNEAWRTVSPIIKFQLACQIGKEKYGESDPQTIDEEWIASDTLVEAIPQLEKGHLLWRLRPKRLQNSVTDKIFGYYFAGT